MLTDLKSHHGQAYSHAGSVLKIYPMKLSSSPIGPIADLKCDSNLYDFGLTNDTKYCVKNTQSMSYQARRGESLGNSQQT